MPLFSCLQTRSGRRNRRAGSEAPPVIHHFRRVPGPLRAPASKSHPHQLAGLYKGLYGPHGCEMLAVSYDFSGSAAQIVATKVTGTVYCRYFLWGPPGVTCRHVHTKVALPTRNGSRQLCGQEANISVVLAVLMAGAWALCEGFAP
jgi:hypothetical protein